MFEWILDWLEFVGLAEPRPRKKGYGHYGGNGSVHAIENGVHRRDPMPVAVAGTRFGRPGTFRVDLRFESREAANKALREIELCEIDGKTYASCFVPMIERMSIKENQPLEVRVNW